MKQQKQKPKKPKIKPKKTFRLAGSQYNRAYAKYDWCRSKKDKYSENFWDAQYMLAETQNNTEAITGDIAATLMMSFLEGRDNGNNWFSRNGCPRWVWESYAYLRNKLRIPTATWRDIWQKQHAKAFLIAEPWKMICWAICKKALLKAMRDGTTLEDFRKNFDQIVQKAGWSYNGSRGWRTKVIFNTNMRQSHMAGRWEQSSTQ